MRQLGKRIRRQQFVLAHDRRQHGGARRVEERADRAEADRHGDENPNLIDVGDQQKAQRQDAADQVGADHDVFAVGAINDGPCHQPQKQRGQRGEDEQGAQQLA